MEKEMNWLDKFAQDQAKKMEKTASSNEETEQFIIGTDDLDVEVNDGDEVVYKDDTYKVINSSYSDAEGDGILLEKISVKEAAKVKDEEDEELKIEVDFDEENEEVDVEVELDEEEVDVEVEEIEEDLEEKLEDDVDKLLETEDIEIYEEEEKEDSKINVPEMEMEMGTENVPAPSGDEQEYARNNPGEVYHIEVRDGAEQDKFENEAVETENQIAEENAVDRTTPEGRYSNNRIFNRMIDEFNQDQSE